MPAGCRSTRDDYEGQNGGQPIISGRHGTNLHKRTRNRRSARRCGSINWQSAAHALLSGSASGRSAAGRAGWRARGRLVRPGSNHRPRLHLRARVASREGQDAVAARERVPFGIVLGRRPDRAARRSGRRGQTTRRAARPWPVFFPTGRNKIPRGILYASGGIGPAGHGITESALPADHRPLLPGFLIPFISRSQRGAISGGPWPAFRPRSGIVLCAAAGAWSLTA